jgi:hypothetical protein
VRYAHLPEIGTHGAPSLTQLPSPNRSSRNGRVPRLIFVHVWGGGTFDSTVSWLRRPESQVSAHVVYGGVASLGAERAAQLVPWHEKAWTECDLNAVGISVESADAIWQGRDPIGFATLARMVAVLCHLHFGVCRYVPASGILSSTQGFTRHADAGALGCGHLYCPTEDESLWGQFVERTVAEFRHGGFRSSYGA